MLQGVVEGNKNFEQKLEELEKKYHQLLQRLSTPGITENREEFISLSKELGRLKEGMILKTRWEKWKKEMEDLEEIKGEPGLEELVREEKQRLEKEGKEILKEIQKYFSPPEEGNVIMEIRAGTGGEEAALFAKDLFRMYLKFAEKRGWRIEIISSHPTPLGGFKEIIFAVEGEGAWSDLKYESGVHRVQRVPETESGGRIHTSAATVAVLPERKGEEIEIKPEDIRIDVFRASGPGGQYVNVTDSAVRITHIPTGIVVTCQDERSQHQNRAKAMRILKAKLQEIERRKREEEIARKRREQIKHGERSEKIRTYNFPQNRVTDHRIGLTLHRLKEILEGDLDELLSSLKERLP